MLLPRFLRAICSATAAITCLVTFAAPPARADIINVPDDYPTIQAAIDAAEDGDEVVVAPGTYVESITFWPKAITVRSTDPEDPEIVATTIIHPDGGRAVKFEEGAWPDTVLAGFTITGGYTAYGGAVSMSNASPTISNCFFSANSASYAGGAMCIYSGCSPMISGCTFAENSCSGYYGGGAMHIEDGSPTIIACTFRNNVSEYHSGAMVNKGDGDVLMMDCSFTENFAPEGSGAIYSTCQNFTITNCTFTRNSTYGSGGAITSWMGALTVTDCTFTENVAEFGWSHGGGMNLFGDATVSGCTFTRNRATRGGGGLQLSIVYTVTVTDCTFNENEASWGGGLACYYPDLTRDRATPTDVFHAAARGDRLRSEGFPTHIDDCTFIANSGVDGAGLYYSDSGVGPIAITRCSFLRNQADADGGGMVCRRTDEASVSGCAFVANTAAGNGGGLCNMENWGIENYDISNCTFSANAAGGNGDGMYNDRSDVTAANCILWGDGSNEIYNFSSSPVVSFCNVQGGYEGEGNIDADPLFVDPDNGDYRLSPGSPCVDAADNTAVPPDELDLDEDGDTEEPIPFDLEGNGRLINDPCTEDTGNGEPPMVDIGAYEFQPSCPCDLDCDGNVGTADLLFLLGAWGTGAGDVDGDGDTDTADLLTLLGAWGECP